MLNETQIKALEEKGFSRWTKGTYDRLYLNAEAIGLECEYYKTGNIRYAEFKGEHISNTQARALKYAKTFIDINTGKLYGDDRTMKQEAQALYDEVIGA